jgi:hypothetical protein
LLWWRGVQVESRKTFWCEDSYWVKKKKAMNLTNTIANFSSSQKLWEQ